MANKKSAFKKIQDTEGSGFGTYQESTGGGKPFSTSNTRTTRENGKYRQANNKTNQPRTNDGKFTYKSANGQSIDPKYGPSRGKTVNPLLTGGENGIKIEDVEKQWDAKKGDIWDKFKDKWYRKGSESILGSQKDYRTKVAGESIWEIARQRYDEVRKAFGGKIVWDANAKEWVATEEGKEEDTWSETKKGRPSATELAAKKEAKKSGDVFVQDPQGGIQLAPNAISLLSQAAQQPAQKPIFTGRMNANTPNQHRWVPKMANPSMTTAQYQAQQALNATQAAAAPAPSAQTAPAPSASASVQPQNVQQHTAPAPKAQPTQQLTHTKDEIDKLRVALRASDKLKDKSILDRLSDKQLDNLYDQLVAK